MLIVLIFANCAQKKVTRVNEEKQIDLSGRWNDTDSRLVAEEMIGDALSRFWLSNFVNQFGRQPVVIIGLVKNKTHEHISAETFIKDMEKEFINSGKVKLVQAGAARDELREERADQQEFASVTTMKQWGLEKGADFMMQGVINSIVDSDKNESVIFYQVDLELSNLETNEKVWIGDKKIKKLVQN
jgi:uncharacterized protein (TIGR02722 family)